MRTEWKTAFRPSIERVEPRVVATAGVVSAMAVHHPKPPHHASHPPKPQAHPAEAQTTVVVIHSGTAPAAASPPPVSTTSANNSTTNQAWVKIENMTGRDLEYEIKLGPYANGQFLPFDIGAGATQYRMSSLISGGQRAKADFAIQFGNGPVTPLMTGISQGSAQGYYIFLDGNLNPYVASFIG